MILKALDNLRQCFSNKLEQMEEKLTCKLLQTMRNEIGAVQTDFDNQIMKLTERIAEMEKFNNEHANEDISRNIIIRNLQDSPTENVLGKVNGLIRDGLRLKDVAVMSAERKKSYKAGTPGVVVARCKSGEDKAKIMIDKRHLVESRNFKDIYINHDKSHQQRTIDSNFKVLLANGRNDRLVMKGSRIVQQEAGLAGRRRPTGEAVSRQHHQDAQRKWCSTGDKHDHTSRTPHNGHENPARSRDNGNVSPASHVSGEWNVSRDGRHGSKARQHENSYPRNNVQHNSVNQRRQ